MTEDAAKTSADPISIVAMEQSFPKDQRIVVDDLGPTNITIKCKDSYQGIGNWIC